MGQNDELARIFCVRDAQLSPKFKDSRGIKIKIFAYIAIIICFFAAFTASVSYGQMSSIGEAKDGSDKPVYVVFAIDASNSMSSTLKDITKDKGTLYKSIEDILSMNIKNKVGLVIWNTNKSYNKQLINTELTNDRNKLKNAISFINSWNISGDYTCFADGLIKAKGVLKDGSNGNKNIIFISDGIGHNCHSKDSADFCQEYIMAGREGINLYGLPGICTKLNENAYKNDTMGITEYLSDITRQIISQTKTSVVISVEKEPTVKYIPGEKSQLGSRIKTTLNFEIPIPLGIGVVVSIPTFVLFFLPVRWLPRRWRNSISRLRLNLLQKIRNIYKNILRLFKRPSPNEVKDIACRGDMMIKKSVTKNVIPNVITIDRNGSASEDITIEITLPTERCCIGADVALALDCSASMYNSDGDKEKRKGVVESIITCLRRDADRVSLLYWNNGQLDKKQSITNEFNLVSGHVKALSGDDQNNLDKGGTNFNELLKGAMDSIYVDRNDGKPHTRSVIIVSDAVPEGEDGPGGLKFDLSEMIDAINVKEKEYRDEKVAFYSVGIKQHPLGKPILEDITKLGGDKHHGIFVSIEDGKLDAIKEKMKDICKNLEKYENLDNVRIVDILPPYLKEPHDFRKICKPINGRLSDVEMTPAPTIETNLQTYTTNITWDLGSMLAKGDVWKLTFKARLEFPLPTNMTAMSNENIMSQITYNDKTGKQYKILLDPGEIRFKAATE